jgi:Fe(3+) dicitrate transport protein
MWPNISSAQDDETFVLPPTVVEGFQPSFTPAFDPAIGAGAVFGDVDSAMDAPGSGAFLDFNDLNTQSYDNVDRVLNQVPGVYLRGEDGFGNFPNISLRGVDTTRSAKVTIMEDGVLTAPAPYSAPSAYYFPTVGRMSAVEVVKGHSQIIYGPHTTGGAINFLSTQIPEESSAYIRSLYGSFNEYRVHSWVGSTMDTKIGRIGFLIEGYLRETDGFKTINQPSGFGGANQFALLGNTQDSGFTKGDTMFKLFWEPCTDLYQRWEAKVGYTDFDSNETYLGISEMDFAADPFQRYPTSRFDNFSSNHVRSYLRYTIGDPDCNWMSLTNTAYYNKFHRNWYKAHDVREVDGVALPSADRALSRNIEDGTDGLRFLRGELNGVLRIRANNRDYYAYGYNSVASKEFCTGSATHNVKAGVRYHSDQIHPFQHNDDYTLDDNGFVDSVVFRAPGSQRNRIQEVHAVACFAQDAISYGNLTITPGVRFEHLNMSTIDFNAAMPALGRGDLDLVGGGVGLTYDYTDELKFIAGFHRGFSPPNPRGLINNGLSEEESLASEAGFRYSNAERAFGTQVIGFYTHFNDLLVIDNVGGTGTGDTESIGEVYSGGIEFSMQYDAGEDKCWGFSTPMWITATYTDARLLNDVNSTDPESLFAGGMAGNRLPYIPEFAFTTGSGVHFELFGFDITGIYVDDTFTTASNVETQTDANGDFDARFGKTDEYYLVDLSGYVRLGCNWKLFGGLQNVFDVEYLASRHPHGPRPGAPLFGYAGLEAVY